MLSLKYVVSLRKTSAETQAIFWKILSCACFAALNCLIRYLKGNSSLPLSAPLPAYVLDFFQNLFAVLLLLPWLLKKRASLTIQPSKNLLLLHAARVLLGLMGVGAWYAAFEYLPVAQCLALSFVGPIFTMLGASVWLKEKLSWNRQLALLLSFVGAFLVNRPDAAIDRTQWPIWSSFLPILAAFGFAMTNLLSRKLSLQGENSEKLTWTLLVWTLPLSLIAAAQNWVFPHPEHWFWLILLGLFSACAQIAYNKAYALAEVSLLLPFGCSKHVLSLILAYLIFGELPRTAAFWLGSMVLLCSLVCLNKNFTANRQIKTTVH